MVFGAADGFNPLGDGAQDGSFFSPTLLLCRDAFGNDAVHDVEAFGPVSTMMPYKISTKRWRWPHAARAAW